MGKFRQINLLPDPLNKDQFRLLRRGISDNSDIDVWVNDDLDFACLDPVPTVDYETYIPRAKKFNLEKYKNNNAYFMERLEKIKKYVSASDTILEVGASDGHFLECLKKEYLSKKLYAVEPDSSTLAERNKRNLSSYSDIKDFLDENIEVDMVCMFHVFEHLEDPGAMLVNVSNALGHDGKLIIEVPALSDPLLGLYEIEAFSDFYFQAQHPYIYTSSSLKRVLESNGYKINEVIPFQRYGLGNHLSWLKNNRPGGDSVIEDVVSEVDHVYRNALEKKGQTDSVIVVVEVRSDF
jgi:2-polyprenyl-3-methyl-5-hydroxy-6-metoxy-1,4-benzoquinol methylase